MQVNDNSNRTDCKACPLQKRESLRPLDEGQIEFMNQFKQGEMALDRGAQLFTQGINSPHLYTLLNGVMMRYRLLEDGRRQVVNYMFPGDIVGIQGAMNDSLDHCVEAITSCQLCIFLRENLPALYQQQPQLGFDITWLAAKEESALEEHLVTLGQRKAAARLAYLALFLLDRGEETGMGTRKSIRLSISQAQIADTLGLSHVHTNRTIQMLKSKKLLDWSIKGITVVDRDALEVFAESEGGIRGIRPFV